MLRIGGWHSHILGGIKLQVRQSEARDAMAVLQHVPPRTRVGYRRRPVKHGEFSAWETEQVWVD